MRIAISINTSWNIYNFRSGLIKALQAEGHEVFAIAPKDEYSQKLVDELGIEFYPIQIDNKGSNPIKDFMLIQGYKTLFKKVKPDIILQYTIKPNIYGSIAAKSLNIPTINNVSGLGTIFINPKSITSRIGRLLYKYAFQFPKKVFFQNPDDQKLFIENKLVSKSITDVLPGSGVNLEKFKFTPKKKTNPFIFLMISRALYDKGLVEYVEAAKLILKKHSNVEFQLLGTLDYSKGSIPKPLFQSWVDDRIINYLGTTDDVASKIINADCIVLPSYREGTPKTLLEALAIGRPIVTTNVPGCKETVIDGENGYLCEVKNSANLANKMIEMLGLEGNKLISMSVKSRGLAEAKFDDRIVYKQYINTINEIY